MGIGQQAGVILSFARACGLGIAFALVMSKPLEAECAPDNVSLMTSAGAVSFSVELALTPEQTAQGLMFREDMAADAGMLFFFDPPRRVSFWMRNTLIPLDMIFVDARGVVRKVHPNAIPGDETSIPGNGPTRAVLEINGGLAARLGITEGALMQHPLFDQSRAALPC